MMNTTHSKATMKHEATDPVKREATAPGAQQRDHLRALLERARSSGGLHRAPVDEPIKSETPAQTPLPINADQAQPTKRIISLKPRTNRPDPPAFLPTPRGSDRTPLLPVPGTADHPVNTSSRRGLLPNPNFDQYEEDRGEQHTQHPPHFVNATDYPRDVGYYAAASSQDHEYTHRVPYPPLYAPPPAPFSYPAMPVGHPCSCTQGYAVSIHHQHPQEHYPCYPSPPVFHMQTPQPLLIPTAYTSYEPSHQDSVMQASLTRSPAGPKSHTVASPTASASTSSTEASSDISRTKTPSSKITVPNDQSRDVAGPCAKSSNSAARTTTSPSFGIEEYEDNELHSDFVHSVHVLIPEDSFGCLVGPRGQIMKEINAASMCTLSVREPQTFPEIESHLVLRIYGKPKGICLAQRLVIERIREHRLKKGDTSYTPLQDSTLAPLDEAFIPTTVAQAIAAAEDANEAAVVTNGQLKWLIHRDDVGKIMGSEGVILRAIARDTNTTLRISSTKDLPPGSFERTVSIKGDPDAIEQARRVIESKAGGRPEVQSGKLGQYFVFPRHAAGFLIGPQGSRVRQIRDDTGARVQIPAQQDIPFGYLNRTLHIQGSGRQIETASAKLKNWLEAFIETQEARDAAGEDEVALQLILSTRICGFLLDQKGRLIREITEKSGAHARMLPALNDEHRVCVLYGDLTKVLRAERLVLQFVAGDAIANKRATSSGIAPRKRKARRDDSDEDAPSEIHSADSCDDDDGYGERAHALRGRPRKRPNSALSGRVVVHYAEPLPRTGSNRVAARRDSNRGGKRTTAPVHRMKKQR